MARAFIALGSNIEPEANLPRAVGALRALGRVAAVSRVYRNAAIGAAPAPEFLNAAVLLETGLEPLELRAALRRLEAEAGRVRGPDRYAPRTLDLDLVLYDDRVIEQAGLRIPDPDLLTRAHLAVTAAELDPGFVHPQTGETLGEIAGRLRSGADLRPCPEVEARLRGL